ncbi:MAG: efflux RND transporter permease subunit [Flavobacteriales bacterium]|nr:efflux RND transporter permease subunit [Flavobacteriales bacterium]MCB9449653.1 efflux RND transporter permease subunit [Flavobacteriales bacterium]
MSNQEKKGLKREFFLSTLSVNNRTTVMVLMFIIVIMGLVSYSSMPKASFPDIIIPQIYVGTAYPGNSPADMEKLITRPLEKEINTITDVEKITSTSLDGYSTILVEFDFSVSPTEALRKVKDAVDKARAEASFPKDLPAEPNIFEMNFSEFPILNINLSGDFSPNQLKEYAEYLEDRIEDIPEISRVDIRGLQEKEVEISVDKNRMEALNISFNDIAGAVSNENLTIAGGEILVDGLRRTVRAVGDFNNMDEIRNIIVKQEKGNIVYLKDIADVNFQFEERKSYAREFEKPVVMLDVVKRAGQNLLSAMDEIKVVLDDAKKTTLPPNLTISLTNDQSQMTRNMVDNLENSIISGVILVVLVLLFFLGVRNALFVGIAIPLSMLTAFVVLGAMGATINMMVLFGLILALGMLVDNGIVVVENIYRLMSEGMSARQAAKEGAGEVAIAIIASTATTLAAFLPLMFWPGMMGEFMGFLPLTLIIVLGSSLFVGLVINPVFTALWMKVEEDKVNKKLMFRFSGVALVLAVLFYAGGFITMGSLLICCVIISLINGFLLVPGARRFQDGAMPRVEKFYERFLAFALKKGNRLVFFFGTIGMLVLSFFLLGVFTPKVLFFPENMPKYVNIFIELPIGTDIEKTDEVTRKVEHIVMNEVQKFEVDSGNNFLVESVIANVGQGTTDPNEGPSMGNTPHRARITVNFREFQYRTDPRTGDKVNTSDVMEDLRKAVKGKIPGVKIRVEKDKVGPPAGAPINIEITGDDIDQLLSEGDKIRSFIESKNILGIDELKLDIELGKPELIIDIDRAKARRLSLSTGLIASTIRTALYGNEISQYKEGEDEYPIQLRFKNRYRYDVESLMNTRITFRDQTSGRIKQVPVSAVASARQSSTYSSIKRKNANRVVTVFSSVAEGYNPTEVVSNIKGAMDGYKLPDGMEYKFTGEQEEQAKEMSFLGKALVIAVLLIFLIIVAQFNSAATPVLIVASVVFSLTGVLLGLVIFQMEFVVIMTMIGIISLAGVVVNNAIVLIDFTNLLRDRRKEELGLGEDDKLPFNELVVCVIQAGKTRLRPVLLTAITTVLGLVPLATGMNINFFTLLSDLDADIYFGGDNVIFWGPMSWAVIFGLSFATFLTLVIIPVMYLMKERLKYSASELTE